MLERILNRRYRKAILTRLNGQQSNLPLPSGGRTHRLFVMSMFLLMGKLAKMDGRVTSNEIKYASSIMQLLGLSNNERKRAIAYFEQGKKRHSEPTEFVEELAYLIGKGSSLAKLFLQIQCRHALVKGGLRLKEKVLLRDLAEILGFQKSQLNSICRELAVELEKKTDNCGILQKRAYLVLQLEPEVEDSEIKKAYLRMMSKYHPDKVVSENLTEESLKELHNKAMEIRAAYEALCGIRKLRA